MTRRTRATTMSERVEKYLQLRRSLGFQLRIEGKLLQQFAAFADASKRRGPLTTEMALQWARKPADGDRLYWARRLEVVRCFARCLAVTEPDTQIPPRGLLGPAHRRTTPYVFTDEEVAALIAGAERLAPSNGLRPRTYAALIGTLACAGLRISEALHLSRVDADLERGILTIHRTKFRKSRLAPLHATTVAALRDYATARDRLLTAKPCERFFVSSDGRPLPYSTVRHVFRELCRSLKIDGAGGRRPRLHDLRHSFACRRIERWYDAGVDLNLSVAALSVYLGHAKVSDTYWYLTATPNLLSRAAERFEALAPMPRDTEVNR